MNRVAVDEISRDLEVFIRDRFEVEADDTYFSTDLNLWEEGYIDSVGVIELIAHLETTYAIQVPRAMLFDPAFTSVNGIAERIATLLT